MERRARAGAFGEFTDGPFVRRVLIVIGLFALAYGAWQLSGVLLLVFGAVLFAVILSALAALIARYTPVPERWSLVLATIGLLALVLAFLFLFGAQIAQQIGQVTERLPAALDNFARELGTPPISERLPQILSGRGSDLLRQAANYGLTVIGGLADLVLVIVAGVYIAADPGVYRTGLVKLFPIGQHERIESAIAAMGAALRRWLAGQLVAMLLVGILSGLAYWWIGLPAPLGLGAIAGLTNFIPLLGPIIGAVPAVLLAFTQDGATVLWTILAALAIQQIEGNVITPNVEKRAVAIPPALVLFSILAFGYLFGILGAILAAPLTVVVFVLVKKLYVRETLGEETSVPGEKAAEEDAKSGLA